MNSKICDHVAPPPFRDEGVFARVFRWVALLSACWVMNGYSADSTNDTQVDLVAFFKHAISTPRDVEQFTVSQRDIQKDAVTYYIGARSGSNYFLQVISNSNLLQDLNKRQLIAGRSGSNLYELSRNAVSFATGSNALTVGVGMLFTFTRQALDMGLAEVKPESVKWSGNTFTATEDSGNSRTGELLISNGLPARLEVSNKKGAYKVIEYAYPDPPDSFGGFPSKMMISSESKGQLDPHLEVIFYSVRLATDKLPENYFSAAQFVGTNIAHTNIYQGADLYVQNRLGQMVKAPDSIRKSGGHTNARPRTLIFLCFAIVTSVPLALLFFFRIRKNEHVK